MIINESHTKSIRIQPDEEDEVPLSLKEDEYKMITKMMYELQTCDLYFVSPVDHIYPRIVMMKRFEPPMVKMVADYGYLDLIYPDKNLKEFEKFDDIFRSEVSKYTQGRSVYIKFYTISPEVDGGIFYPAEHIITIGYVGRNFTIDIGEINIPLPKFTKVWIKNRRVLGYKVLYSMAKNLYAKIFRCLCLYERWTLLANDGQQKSDVLRDFINKFDTHQIPGCTSTLQHACEARDCPTSQQNKREIPKR